MSQVLEVLAVAGLFLLRIGVPVLILLVIGTLVERAHSRREKLDAERPIAIDLPLKTGQQEDEMVSVETRRTFHP